MNTLICSVLLMLCCIGCRGGESDTLIPDPHPANDQPEDSGTGTVIYPSGFAESALGACWFVRDPDDPSLAHLEPIRSGFAQGDLYALSVRPYLKSDSLQLVGTQVGALFTDYTIRFEHPWPIPANFEPPATSLKRMDLFLFDTCLVAAIDGASEFFNGAVKVNWSAVENVDGFRQIHPFLDIRAFQVNTANTFPYKLLWSRDDVNPQGNYDATSGWSKNEWFAPKGYDVVPQGGVLQTTIRIRNTHDIPNKFPFVTIAKYMDPRSGNTILEKRASRLPLLGPPLLPGEPPSLMYYLPEACGDIQQLIPSMEGALPDDNSAVTRNITIRALDWDNAATVAESFPDYADYTKIAERSVPSTVEIDLPALQQSGPFAWTSKRGPFGVANEYLDLIVPIRNVDRNVAVGPSGTTVKGFIRVWDTQDQTDPVPVFLKEGDPAPVPFTPAPGFAPSIRYQKIEVPLIQGTPIPNLTGITPSSGFTQVSTTFQATNTGGAATSWSWNFGGGASPDSSSASMPNVTLGATGTYYGSVTATNARGDSTFLFTLEVNSGSPNVVEVAPNSGMSGTQQTIAAINAGGAPTSWVWNFGGGATPNTSTLQEPLVTLSATGSYAASVKAMNDEGESMFPFTLNVFGSPASPPNITDVQPRTAISGSKYRPIPTNSGGEVTEWLWDFSAVPGASPTHPTNQFPEITLNSVIPATYICFLGATGPGGAASPPLAFQLVVESPPPPSIMITDVQPRRGNSGMNFQPQASYEGQAFSWSWSFGGGAMPSTSTQQYPNVVLGAPGSYFAFVTALGPGGAEAYMPFTLIVDNPPAGPPPVISDVQPRAAVSGSAYSPVITNTGGSATWWHWDLSNVPGAAPGISDQERPSFSLSTTPPGTYAAGVTMWGPGGGSEPFSYWLTVASAPSTAKRIGLDITVLKTSTGQLPELWSGLSAWTEPAMRNWIVTYINPIFAGANVQFDPNHISMNFVTDDWQFNLHNKTELNNLNTLYVQTNPPGAPRLRLVIINRNIGVFLEQSKPPPGQMQDTFGSRDNAKRGAWVTSALADGSPRSLVGQRWTVGHELGHVMYLPHICDTCVTSTNLMSYGAVNTGSLVLSSEIPRIASNPGGSYLHPGSPMDQFQIVEDWCREELPTLP